MADESIFDKIVLADTLEGVGTGRLENYLAHALCIGGEMDFDFNGSPGFKIVFVYTKSA